MEKTFILFIGAMIFLVPGMAQNQEQKIMEFEMQRRAADQRMLSAQLDTALYLFEQAEYARADEKFRFLLKAYKSIPSDLVFYFGRNSYHLGNFSQSIDWLNKYIQLKGTTGQFSEQAIDWLKKAESEVLKQRQIQSQQAAQVLSRDFDIDCGPTGKVTCPVCNGSTVIIKKGYIENTYRTCPYCNKHGILECHEYNQLLRGELQPLRAND